MAYKITKEIRKKLIESHKGQIPWNKGLKGYLKGRKITWANKISIGKKNSLKSKIASQKAVRNMLTKRPSRKGIKSKPLSEETKKKISDTCKRKGIMPPKNVRAIRERNGAWKGGISFIPYTIDWTNNLRISIRERDKYTCKICGEKQGDRAFSVHHIDYNKKNCNPENLVTLCIKCHTKTNHNRDYWINYFKNIYGKK
jgi:5-methylcytosine-specific restriction endonuclease McrA